MLVCEGSLLVLQNLWDLTPDTDLLKELPENYSFETALADLIVSVSVLLSKKVKCLMENSCACVGQSGHCVVLQTGDSILSLLCQLQT